MALKWEFDEHVLALRLRIILGWTLGTVVGASGMDIWNVWGTLPGRHLDRFGRTPGWTSGTLLEDSPVDI